MDIIIWGAGKSAQQRYEWAVFAGYRILFFVDNNPDLWGERVYDISIEPPTILKNYNCLVLTSDIYFKEIRKQLAQLGYTGSQIGFKRFKREAVCGKADRIDLSNTKINDEASFVFDSYFEGMNWGGTEEWNCMVANAIADLGVQTHMLCGMNDKFDRFTKNCMHFEIEDELSMVTKMAKRIAECLPCVYVSQTSITMFAAQIVKAAFPDKIKIVCIAHGDEPHFYDNIFFWAEQVDKIVCISNKIYSVFQERYGLKKEKLIYRMNPIKIPQINKRKSNKGTLIIGYAARLAKVQKRAHFLPQIFDECKSRHLDVEFNIAGEGDCLKLLEDYVNNCQLKDMVHILGWIPPTDMMKFWTEQDVYLNISDFEGMSLAMLEAMACGCLPIVTDVSGVKDVIEDGRNGLVVPVDQWLNTVEKIEFLCNNRELLLDAGIYNRKLIKDRLDVADYAKWMVETTDIGFGCLVK